MFNNKTNKVFDNKVNGLIDKANESDSKENDDVLVAKYSKDEMFAAIGRLNANNNELLKLQNEINDKGEQNMDDKDMKILLAELNTTLDEKFEKKFNGLNSDLKNISDNVGQTCEDGKCFTTQLNDLNERLGSIDTIKNEVNEIKSSVKEELNTMNDSISTMNDNFNQSLATTNEKLGETCVGVDCITERFKQEDDMVECSACHHTFSLSENTLGDIVICPNCRAELE